MEKKVYANNVVDFIKEKKGRFIEKDVWYSGGTVEVSPIMKYYHDNGDATIRIQLTNCDKRNFNRFENVLKKRFEFVEYAYYDETDGSCPSVYVVRLSFR